MGSRYDVKCDEFTRQTLHILSFQRDHYCHDGNKEAFLVIYLTSTCNLQTHLIQITREKKTKLRCYNLQSYYRYNTTQTRANFLKGKFAKFLKKVNSDKFTLNI